MRLIKNERIQNVETGSIVYGDYIDDAGDRTNSANGKCANLCVITTGDVGKAFKNIVSPVESTAMPIDGAQPIKVEPMLVRKTPKFPSRERHMAIRRKKLPTLAPLPWSAPRATSSSTCCCNNTQPHVGTAKSSQTQQWANISIVKEESPQPHQT